MLTSEQKMRESYPRLVQMTSLGSGAASASQAVLSWCSMEFDATACTAARHFHPKSASSAMHPKDVLVRSFTPSERLLNHLRPT